MKSQQYLIIHPAIKNASDVGHEGRVACGNDCWDCIPALYYVFSEFDGAVCSHRFHCSSF